MTAIKGLAFPSFANQRTPKPHREYSAHCGTRVRLRHIRRRAVQKDTPMSHDNGNGKLKHFQAPAGTQLVGQPLTVLSVGVPINMTLTCNCGEVEGRPVLTILQSTPVTCPRCGMTYGALFNPQNMQIQMQVGRPAPADDAQPPADQVPS